jgi:hypothetical protein
MCSSPEAAKRTAALIQLGETSIGQSGGAARASELNLAVDDFRQVQDSEKSSDRLEIP